jgi:hypothetical protein
MTLPLFEHVHLNMFNSSVREADGLVKDKVEYVQKNRFVPASTESGDGQSPATGSFYARRDAEKSSCEAKSFH